MPWARERRTELLYIIHKGHGPSKLLPAPTTNEDGAAVSQTALGLQSHKIQKNPKPGFLTTLLTFLHAQQPVCDPHPTLLWSSAHTQGSFSSLFQKLDDGRELSEVRDGFSVHITGTHPRLDLELQLPQTLQAKPV